jgi:hypothetical protein
VCNNDVCVNVCVLFPGVVFSCPEGAAVRQKMLYSTAKSSVIDTIAACGVSIGRHVSVSDAGELAASATATSSESTETQARTRAGIVWLCGMVARAYVPL